MLIANSPRKLALAISMSRDTGLRPAELMNLKLGDIGRGLVYPESAKDGAGRVLKLKSSTLDLLSSYLAKHPEIGLNDRIFGGWNSDSYSKWFRVYRNKLAAKLNDLGIKTIRLYDLRHYYATMLYHKTRDTLLVKQQLGHRKIETTLIYTQLVNSNGDDEYHSATAKTIEEARKLVEEGFDYVATFNDVMPIP